MSSSSENPGNAGSPSSKGGASSGGTSTGGVNAGAPNELAGGAESVGGAENGGASAGAGTGATAAGGRPPAAMCPNLFGAYTIKTRAGSCGDFDKSAPQTITGNDVTCAATFVSAPKTGKPAINGMTKIDAKGDFAKATLTLGSVAHDPCSGVWSAGTRLMTVTCGKGANECIVVLQKE